MLDTFGCTHLPRAAPSRLVAKLITLPPIDVGAGQRPNVEDSIVIIALETMLPATKQFRPEARLVRAVLFNKSARRNWAVPWHQDRTIAIKQCVEVAGFSPWSVKDKVTHVEPPFALLADMVTMRLHLDDCSLINSPLCVALGSHRSRVPAFDVLERARVSNQLKCLANRGDIWTYATPILHCSDRAEMPSRRRVLQVDFCQSELPGGLEWSA